MKTKTHSKCQAKEKLSSYLVIALLLAITFGPVVSPTTADQGNSNEWVCIFAPDEIDHDFELLCEEGDSGQIITCWVSSDEVVCEGGRNMCEGQVLGDGTFAYISCGDPVNQTCWATEDEMGCENIPNIDLPDGPDVSGAAANLFNLRCQGFFDLSDEDSTSFSTEILPVGEVTDLNPILANSEPVHDIKTDFIYGDYQHLRNDLTEIVGPILPNIYTPGGFHDEEDAPWAAAGIGVSIGLFVLQQIINHVSESPDVEEDIFPTRDWIISCGAEVGMDGKCEGSILLEERLCVFIIREGSTENTYQDVRQSACTYNYAEISSGDWKFDCRPMADFAIGSPSGTPYEGTFQPGDRNLPMAARVEWPHDATLKLQSRPKDDSYSVLPQSDAEQAANIFSPTVTSINWQPLRWDVLIRPLEPCGGSNSAFMHHFFSYNPNSLSLSDWKTCVEYTG